MSPFKILLAASLLLMSSTAFSQSKYYYPGYIVDHNEDTISGFIKDNPLLQNTLSVSFKTDSLGTEEKTIYPDYIKVFFYEPNNLYFSKKIEENGGVNVFLLALVSSEVSLYKTSLKKSELSYYIEKDGRVYLLEQRETNSNDGTIKVNNKYKNTLKFLFNDCDDKSILVEANELNFTERDLIRITLKYNRCKEAEIVDLTKKKSSPKISFGIVGGVNYSNIDLIDITNYTDEDFESSLNPILGVYADKEVFKRFNAGIKLYYTSYKGKLTFSPRGDLFTDNVNLSFQYIEASPVLKYELTKTSFKPYVILGAQFGYLLSKEITVESTRSYRSKDFSDEEMQKLNSGYQVGLGFSSSKPTFSKFNLEIFYSTSKLNSEGSNEAIFRSVNGRLVYKVF